MKIFIKIIMLLSLLTNLIFAQEELLDWESRTEIYIATSGLVVGQSVRYKMEALGTAWEKTSSDVIQITTNPFYQTSYYPGRNYPDSLTMNSDWISPLDLVTGWQGYNWQLDANNPSPFYQDDYCWGLYRFSVWLFDGYDTYIEKIIS